MGKRAGSILYLMLAASAALLLSGCASDEEGSRAEVYAVKDTIKAAFHDAAEEALPPVDIVGIMESFDPIAALEEESDDAEYAFYIPPNFSKDKDMEYFVLLELLENGTVVYAFTTSYSGDLEHERFNEALPYGTAGTASTGESKRVMVLMACNAWERKYAIYHVEEISENTFISAQKDCRSPSVYVLFYEAKLRTFPVQYVSTLPVISMDRRCQADLTWLANYFERPGSAAGSGWIPGVTYLDMSDIYSWWDDMLEDSDLTGKVARFQEVYCLNDADFYTRFCFDYPETSNPYRVVREASAEDLEDGYKSAARPDYDYMSRVSERVAEADRDFDEDGDYDILLLHMGSATLRYSFPAECDRSYHDGDYFLDVDADIDPVSSNISRDMDSVDDIQFCYSRADDGGIVMVAEIDMDDGPDMVGIFPVVGWEERDFKQEARFSRLFPKRRSTKTVRLKVPVISPDGVMLSIDTVEGCSFVSVDSEYLSSYETDSEAKTCDFSIEMDEDAVLRIPDGNIYDTHRVEFSDGSGIVFVSDEAFYACPPSVLYSGGGSLGHLPIGLTMGLPENLIYRPNESPLTASPVEYRGYSFSSYGSDSLLVASASDGVVLCNLWARTFETLWEWPCYAVKSDWSGRSFCAVGYQTAESGRYLAGGILDAKLYMVDLDENKSAILMLKKELKRNPELWDKLLSETGRRTLWSTYCSSHSNYDVVNESMREMGLAYKDMISYRDTLCENMEPLRFLSSDERKVLNKALYSCRSWREVERLLETVNESGEIPDYEGAYRAVIDRVDPLDKGEEAAWKPMKEEEVIDRMYDFKSRIVASLPDEKKSKAIGFSMLREYEEWLERFSEKIEGFRGTLG